MKLIKKKTLKDEKDIDRREIQNQLKNNFNFSIKNKKTIFDYRF